MEIHRVKTVDFHSDRRPKLWYAGSARGEAGEYLNSRRCEMRQVRFLAMLMFILLVLVGMAIPALAWFDREGDK